MVAWVQKKYPEALPRTRVSMVDTPTVGKGAKK
jgi:hypothetical protein